MRCVFNVYLNKLTFFNDYICEYKHDKDIKMPKIEEYTPDTTNFFLLDGLRREKGDWGLVYESENEDVLGQQNVGVIYKTDPAAYPLIGTTKFSNYTDSSDTPYTDMASLVADLNTFLGLSN